MPRTLQAKANPRMATGAAAQGMPNATNVISPINIHGIGRSGTTLIQNVMGRTGFIQTCNEMAPFVLGAFRSAQLGVPSTDKEVHGCAGDTGLAVRAVHAGMCSVCPSSKPAWSQKLGGIPNQIVWSMITPADRDFAAKPYPFPYQWVWDAIAAMFPLSKDILMLRDYRDILISGTKFFGHPPADLEAHSGGVPEISGASGFADRARGPLRAAGRIRANGVRFVFLPRPSVLPRAARCAAVLRGLLRCT